jgi:hypothetical protein
MTLKYRALKFGVFSARHRTPPNEVEYTPGFARTANSVAEICPIKEHTGEFIRGYFSDCDNLFLLYHNIILLLFC